MQEKYSEQQNLKECNKTFSNIQVGDIIWAKRYKSEEQKKIIPVGHRVGPFIVISKINKKLICSYGTSVELSKSDVNKYYVMNRVQHKFFNKSRSGQFSLSNFYNINEFQFIRKIGELTNEEKEILLRKIKLKYKKNIDYVRKLNLQFQVGDIILHNNVNYLILDKNNDELISIPLWDIDLNNVLELNEFKKIDYSKAIIIKNKNKIKYIGCVDSFIIKCVLDKYKEYIKYKENNKKRGYVISEENKFYYIYGEEGINWLVFEIFNEESEKKLDKIIISDQIFYTKYKNERINKKENLSYILNATEQEIGIIKKNKKIYNKNHKTKDEPVVLKEEESICINGEEYIIEMRFENIIACTCVYDRNKSRKKIYYFNLNDIENVYKEHQKQYIK